MKVEFVHASLNDGHICSTWLPSVLSKGATVLANHMEYIIDEVIIDVEHTKITYKLIKK